MDAAVALTTSQKKLRAQKAANTSWLNTVDRVGRSQPGRYAAREALFKKIADQVDPDRQLPEAELIRRVGYGVRAHFQGLAYKSSKARAARKASGE